MSENSKWGDPREHQVEAFTTGRYKKEVDVPEKRFLGMVVRRAGKETVEAWGTHSTLDGAVFPDDVEVTRKFKHRCGLIKAVNVLSGSKSTMTLYLDGFHNVILGVENTEFKFDPQLENGPVADILYEEDCTRRGKMKSGRQDVFAAMIFKDQNQMREFVIATTTAPDPEQKTEYHARHVHHGSSDSVSSVWPLAAGVLLGVAISGD
ncbi:MAG: hypothetical protein A3B31_01485 [Candidatus Komeilibacteria bacterium RIFCSPLOWO2_01_FULL_53_11]|uniref:Uncharacterized protein n=1 Tax=Candidatus Komeilibacteria bacterium RIFCSPLOWO2_01_FULL_53_11 TaxID=1798552 RepID=A0A1G2BQH0_9BACT|nr:MAG: hypothetical protein A3B31_01485 [Candidatus Komeilibacteria bacterium RIFCSPLOWO2_01_FULL_53_11]